MSGYHDSSFVHQGASATTAGVAASLTATTAQFRPGLAQGGSRRDQRRKRRVLALGTALLPEIDMARWRALPRSQRRRELRAALSSTASELDILVQSGLEALGQQMAVTWLLSQMEVEADTLCGASKGRHARDRRGRRHGYEMGSVVLGGRRISLLRPRVRSVHECAELVPPSYVLAQDETFLSRAMLMQTLAGAAQRRYAPALSPTPMGLAAGCVSRSTVSRRCQEQMTELLQKVCRRQLESQTYLAVFLDGVEMGGHRVIAAMGVTDTGEKQVLGLWEGATESKEVCQAAVEDLAARGLMAQRGLLVVIDGGKGIHAAVRAVWGERALIQRCQCHKIRNLRDHLPAERVAAVVARMHRAWGKRDAADGERLLRRLAHDLEREGRLQAAGSLREGLSETFTCIRLGLSPTLCTSLETTNAIESAFSWHEDLTHRIKRWHHGAQAQRWLATSLMLAEQSFGRLPGAEHLPQLANALARHTATLPPLKTSA